MAKRLVARTLVLDFLLEHHDAVDQALGAWRTARDVNVYWNDVVDSLHHGVVVEDAVARRGARAHRDAPFGLWHLLPDAAKDRRELEGHASRANQQIRLPGRERLSLHAEAGEVIFARRRRHELDRATRRAEWHRPQRVLAPPVHEGVEACRDPRLIAVGLDE